jgi:hypothetical protein
MTSQTEVEPVLAGVLALLRDKPDTKLTDLAAKVAVAETVQPTDVAAPFPDLPKPVAITDELKRALKHLPAVFGSVDLNTRRSLTQKELDELTLEESVIRLIASVLGPRQDAIKEIIRVHMDVKAEETGVAVPKAKLGPEGEVIVAATPRDQNGHYLLAGPQDPHQVAVGPVRWSQEYSADAAKPSLKVLEDLHKSGEISREDYLAVTRPERVLDESRLRTFIRKNPASGLALLRKITVTGKAKASLYLRKQS